MIFEKLFINYYTLAKKNNKELEHLKLVNKSVRLTTFVLTISIVYFFFLIVYLSNTFFQFNLPSSSFKWELIISISILVLFFDYFFQKKMNKKYPDKVEFKYSKKVFQIYILTSIYLIGPPILLFLSLIIF